MAELTDIKNSSRKGEPCEDCNEKDSLEVSNAILLDEVLKTREAVADVQWLLLTLGIVVLAAYVGAR